MANVYTKSDDRLVANYIGEARFSELSRYTAFYSKPIINKLKKLSSMDAGSIRSSVFIKKPFALYITDCCTLRCNGCSALNHYCNNPRDIEFEEVKRGFDLAFEKIDSAKNIDIVGGEPFLYKALGDILKHIYNSPDFTKSKFGYVNVITNGTLMPDDYLVEILQSTKTHVTISNYLGLSKRRDDLVELFSRKRIYYRVLNHGRWGIACQPAAEPDGAAKKRKECLMCLQAVGTKFYLCPFLAHGADFGIIADDKQNYMNMLSSDFTKENLRAYINGVIIPDGCAYCSGFRKSDYEGENRIPVAQQLAAPIEYKPIHVNT